MAITFSPRQLTRRSQFYQQLGQLLSAGITIVNALEMVSRKLPARSYREPVQRMLQQISQGGNVSDALQSLGDWAPAFDRAMIHAGESSGRLDVIFKLLGNYYAERAAMIRQLISDLAYPVFLFHFSVLIFAFISWVQNARTVSLLIQTLGILLPLYVVIFVMVYMSQSRRGEAWRSFMETIMHPVPMLGTARQSIALARLAAALEALINAGVNIIQAWDIAGAASGSPALQRAIASWKSDLAGGRTPAEMVNQSRQFPEVFANLYHSGEISGQLDDSLRRLHSYYLDDGNQKMRFLSQWVPRVIYLGVALIIGYKIIMFYTGYFKEVEKAIGP
jgi:type II secretory pathway component PulF